MRGRMDEWMDGWIVRPINQSINQESKIKVSSKQPKERSVDKSRYKLMD